MQVTEIEMYFFAFIIVTAIGSYWYGHRTGIYNTLDYLNKEGLVDFKEEENP